MCRGDSMLLYTMTKETLSARGSEKTLSRLERYADDLGISKSEATDRILTQGLDVEESDMRLVSVKTDGGLATKDELANEIERQNRANFLQLFGILTGISYLIVHRLTNPSISTTAITGIPLSIALLYLTYRQTEQ